MRFFLVLFIFTSLSGCLEKGSNKNVGDIPFDETIDDKNFLICNRSSIKQYYVRRSADQSPIYKGEKIALERQIMSQYAPPTTLDQNGYLTIRFIVNCKGQTGRFRMEEMNFNYQPMKFDQKVSQQLMDIVKQLNGWGSRKNEYGPFDYYQYLTFKIKEGKIIKILP